MTSPQPETASMTMNALVKSHNVLVGLAAENLSLREELTLTRNYAAQLEALLHEHEAALEETNGSQETEPVRETRQGQMPEVREVEPTPEGT